ncbi:protein STICHEL-like 2 [Andrographis paniculata]|uniref:protein STICHEL-like 2 n=1 Tax=Andrographis paniculata TaxID=175694 RepID=UPI0021E84DB8|nr:protein STICHEL-like 2 [Andrographis paniculata]
MDGRRHSIDLPISRTLVALKRVRSLRDPLTNSTSKFSALVDNYNWETKSSNAIILGFNDGGEADKNVAEFGSSNMVMSNKHEVDDLEFFHGSRHCGINGKDGGGYNCAVASGDSTEGESLFDSRGKRGHVRSKWKGCNKNHNGMSRTVAGDVSSRVVSQCLSCNGCWTRTPKLRESCFRDRSDAEESPVLFENSGLYESEGVTPYTKSPRNICQKFTPKSFKELVGQDLVARSLLGAISSGRIAPLYLFHGARGVGKTSAARVFAAALNCISPEIDKPCGVCRDCILFFRGKCPDVKEVHPLSINSIGGIRSLIKNADHRPSLTSRFKVYIIDECHLMRGQMWMMLLNKLDALPRHTVFIFITPELDTLPSTAVSKSQMYHFQSVKEFDIVRQLGKICVDEGLEFQEDALHVVATKSNGSLRDAVMMIDHLSLLGKKITMSLVYEVNGVVSEDELLDLLRIAMSSDASNTVKRARELMSSRIDPLHLISQLADLIMSILAGKLEEDASEIRRNFFGTYASEANMKQLSRALKLLSETEKQLRMSKNQATWLTVALLQLSSAGDSPEENDPRLSLRTLHHQDGEYHDSSSNGESLKHPVTGSCEIAAPNKMGVPCNEETLDLMWKRTIAVCGSASLKTFLHKRGKLVSICLAAGIAVAELEFDRPDYVLRAEKSWKLIAGALQRMLGYNVELRINLSSNASSKYGKLKKPCLKLFSCSRRLHLGPHYCIECGSNGSETSCYSVRSRDKFAEMCGADYVPQISAPRCRRKEMVTSIRSSDGNALSIGATLLDSAEAGNPSRADCSWNSVMNGESSRSAGIEQENESSRRDWWKWKLRCWRPAKFPFWRAHRLMMQKRL